MKIELILPKNATWSDLGALLKHGFEAGMRPVRIAFGDSVLPTSICINETREVKGMKIGLGRLVLDLISDYGLPPGSLSPEQEGNVAYLVYTQK